MELELVTLRNIVTRCGGYVSQDEIVGLKQKLDLLESKKRYSELIRNIKTANDKNNFLAHVLETTFAYQFETKGIQLQHEVQQSTMIGGSIDFMLSSTNGRSMYFELSLLQLDKATKGAIDEQLARSDFYRIVQEGSQKEILRIEHTLLGKVQDAKSNPIKFANIGTAADLNVIVIDVSKSSVIHWDRHDFEQVAYGYGADVEELGTFGIFQEAKSNDTDRLKEYDARFRHFREIVSGILFLKEIGGGIIDYRLHGLTMWNPSVSNGIRTSVSAEIEQAIPIIVD